MSDDEDDIMRRREFIRGSLATAGLLITPGVVDSAARLTPADQTGKLPAKVASVEETVHIRALEFPTTPAADSLPTLLRNYIDARRVASEAPGHLHNRLYGSMAYLCAFLAANVADQQDYDAAHSWYQRGLVYALHAEDEEAVGWIAGRATFMAWYQRDDRLVMQDAGYAAMHSPQGQLGTTLGQALAASSAARMGQRKVALQALDAARRATEHSPEQFTAYSQPSFRLGRFASDTYTRLGEHRKAAAWQDYSLPRYPSGAITDPTFLRLDQAQVMAADDPRHAARHATQAVLALTPERALSALLDRADEVADVIGRAGRSDTEHLRHEIRHTRAVA